MSKNNNVGSLSLSTTVVTRFLSLCAVLLALTAIAAAQPAPLAPGWYRNSGPSIIYEDSWGQRIEWVNSYIYPYPGDVPLYWYAQVIYRNMNSDQKTLHLFCDANSGADPSRIKEHMRGTDNSGYVPAEETFCTRNPGFTGSIEPGEAFYDWAIFHNVPWPGGEVSLEWAQFGFSPWVDPWHYPYPSDTPPPAECPPELVTLGTCQPRPLPTPGRTCMFYAPNVTNVFGLIGHVGWAFRDGTGDQWVFGATENTDGREQINPGNPEDTQSWQKTGTWAEVLLAFGSGENFSRGLYYYQSYRCINIEASYPVIAKGQAGVGQRSGYDWSFDNCLTKSVDIHRVYGVNNLPPAYNRDQSCPI